MSGDRNYLRLLDVLRIVEASDCVGGVVPVHDGHRAVHENDTIVYVLVDVLVYNGIDRFLTVEGLVNHIDDGVFFEAYLFKTKTYNH